MAKRRPEAIPVKVPAGGTYFDKYRSLLTVGKDTLAGIKGVKMTRLGKLNFRAHLDVLGISKISTGRLVDVVRIKVDSSLSTLIRTTSTSLPVDILDMPSTSKRAR